MLRFVPWLLLGSLLVFCVSIIFSTIRNCVNVRLITVGCFSTNSTMVKGLKTFHLFTISHLMVALVIPFLLFLASTILLMASLFQHMEQCNTIALVTAAPAWKLTPLLSGLSPFSSSSSLLTCWPYSSLLWVSHWIKGLGSGLGELSSVL